MRNSRIWKRLASAVLALTMVAGIVAGTGTKVMAADEGKITVHKFSRVTIGSDHPNRDTGEAIQDTSAMGRPLAGAGFTLYKLNTTALQQAIKDGKKYVSHVVNTNNSVTFTMDDGSSITASVSEIVGGGEQLTNAAGEIPYTGLADAYYVLKETTTPVGYSTCETSVIRMPLTKADGKAHNRDIHVYPKDVSTAPPVHKVIDGTAKVLNAGEVISFDITADFRNDRPEENQKVQSVHDLKNGNNYGTAYIIDTIQKYFAYNSVTSVTLLNATGNPVGTLSSPAEYTIDQSGLNAARNGDLRVSLTNTGIDRAIAADASSYVVKVRLSYLGSEGFVGNVPPVLKNVAKAVTTKPGGTPPVTPPEVEVFVPTTTIKLNKEDNVGNKFDGAKFRLSKVANPTSTNDYVRDYQGNIIELTTDVNGVLTFNGVDYDEVNGTTYYLQEMETKAGWQLKVGTIAVTLRPKNHADNAAQLDATGNWIQGAVVKAETLVKNYPQGTPDPEEPAFKLPLTGGLGTVLFTIAGIIVMAGAALIYFRSRKKA